MRSDTDPVALLRDYWDRDAETYDRWREHGAWSPAEVAAWASALKRLLPGGGTVLDVGAGTGFLSLAAARLGYEVTAVDVSSQMLACLDGRATAAGLRIRTIHASATDLPAGPFDFVVERLTLWTLPEPRQALEAWRRAAPSGRLVAFEGAWAGRDYVEWLRRRARRQLRRWRRVAPEHHAPYSAELYGQLPLANSSASAIIETIESAGWKHPCLERLRDVEWARLLALPPFDRLFGVTPEFAITAD